MNKKTTGGLRRYSQIMRKLSQLETEQRALEDELNQLRNDPILAETIRSEEQQQEIVNKGWKLKHEIFGTLYVDERVLSIVCENGITNLKELITWLDSVSLPVPNLTKRQINRMKKDMLRFLRGQKAALYGLEVLAGKHPLIPKMIVKFPKSLVPETYRTAFDYFDRAAGFVVSIYDEEFVDVRPLLSQESDETNIITVPLEKIVGVSPGKYLYDDLMPPLKDLDIHELLLIEQQTDGKGYE